MQTRLIIKKEEEKEEDKSNEQHGSGSVGRLMQALGPPVDDSTRVLESSKPLSCSPKPPAVFASLFDKYEDDVKTTRTCSSSDLSSSSNQSHSLTTAVPKVHSQPHSSQAVRLRKK